MDSMLFAPSGGVGGGAETYRKPLHFHVFRPGDVFKRTGIIKSHRNHEMTHFCQENEADSTNSLFSAPSGGACGGVKTSRGRGRTSVGSRQTIRLVGAGLPWGRGTNSCRGGEHPWGRGTNSWDRGRASVGRGKQFGGRGRIPMVPRNQ